MHWTDKILTDLLNNNEEQTMTKEKINIEEFTTKLNKLLDKDPDDYFFLNSNNVLELLSDQLNLNTSEKKLFIDLFTDAFCRSKAYMQQRISIYNSTIQDNSFLRFITEMLIRHNILERDSSDMLSRDTFLTMDLEALKKLYHEIDNQRMFIGIHDHKMQKLLFDLLYELDPDLEIHTNNYKEVVKQYEYSIYSKE